MYSAYGGTGRTVPVPQSGGGTRQFPQAHGTSVHRQQQCRRAPPARVARHGTSYMLQFAPAANALRSVGKWRRADVGLANQTLCGHYVAFSRRCGRRDCAPQPTLC